MIKEKYIWNEGDIYFVDNPNEPYIEYSEFQVGKPSVFCFECEQRCDQKSQNICYSIACKICDEIVASLCANDLKIDDIRTLFSAKLEQLDDKVIQLPSLKCIKVFFIEELSMKTGISFSKQDTLRFIC